jgi:ornithine cyclodeaminase/alanine dehydrogenase-like protein (mu-crystallin family)
MCAPPPPARSPPASRAREVETAGVIGTGVQARLQIAGGASGAAVRTRAGLGARHGEGARLRARLSPALGVEAEASPTRRALVAESQLVVTTTPPNMPVLKADWLHPGLHITAMGSDQDGKNEIDPACAARGPGSTSATARASARTRRTARALAAGLWDRGTPPSSAT